MVTVKAVHGPIQAAEVDTIIVNLFKDAKPGGAAGAVDEALSGAINDLIDGGDFKGKSGDIAVIYPRGVLPAKRVLVVGLGKKDEFDIESVRTVAANAIKKAESLNATNIATILHGAGSGGLEIEDAAQAITESSLLTLYNYRGQKSKNNSDSRVESLDLIVLDEKDIPTVGTGINAGIAIAEGTIVTRDLVNLPPNICTPIYMAERAEKMAADSGLRVEILEKKQMETLKMGALLGVAQGSDTPPRFIILEHNADKKDSLDTVVLVGKGVTFDTGGYSLKTRDGMVGMKSDMAGGGAVIGAMKAIAALEIPLHVVGLVPAADNMVSGNAYRPQDVLTASNGVTIEIISTDAEGRLLLADALVYAGRYKPSAVVDIATLTGSCVVALGGKAAGLFTIDNTLRDTLLAAGDATQERLWSLPLFPEFKDDLKSDTADTKNSSGGRGGASTAAMFLKNFVDYPAWAHIDMAGMSGNAGKKPYAPKEGASGFGVRLFVEFVRQWAKRSNN